MTIAELGAIGEFVGSIVVLATLGFLSLQFKQYRQSLNSSTAHQTYQQINQLNKVVHSYLSKDHRPLINK